MSIPALCIAGTHSGCGKTTVSLGMMAALTRRGLKVQAFKVGPDFIDPGHHRRITGRDSHNLDGWMLTRSYNQEIFERYTEGADIAVVEGVMGLFDGFSGNDESGSTAEMAKWLGIPVITVLDARSMARSAAALALGFSRFDPELNTMGVVFNRVGSEAHREIIHEAMDSLGEIRPVGYLPRKEDLEIPSRHLGLVTVEDFGIKEDLMVQLASWIEEGLDLNHLLENLEKKKTAPVPPGPSRSSGIRIGIARDEAFCFYYPENLRLLREAGAELIPFSPLRDNCLPEGVRGLILGGGYPELHCRTLSRNHDLLEEIRAFGASGKPVYAECGGFMFLMEEILDLSGEAYPMVGVFPAKARMKDRLGALGYREIVTRKESPLGPNGTRVRGHEFHYSEIAELKKGTETVYSVTGRKLLPEGGEGFMKNRVLGSYIHLHWGSNPETARFFVDCCKEYG